MQKWEYLMTAVNENFNPNKWCIEGWELVCMEYRTPDKATPMAYFKRPLRELTEVQRRIQEEQKKQDEILKRMQGNEPKMPPMSKAWR
jgi:hypothetical protein